MEIKFYKHKDIDLKKWDAAIEQSVNGLVYANSWYLNIVNPGWTALIAGDYEIVMPLTYKNKLGIKYLYKSFFSQFLGVFYTDERHVDYVQAFLKEASKYFKFIEINLNVSNSTFNADYCILKQTQVLPLDEDYEVISSKYNRSQKRNIRKVNDEEIIVKLSDDVRYLIELIKLMYKDRKVDSVVEQDYLDLENIVKYALENELGELYYAYSNEDICAAAFFLKWGERATLQTGVNEIGKTKRAVFKLIDNYIQQYAGTNLLLDFAGSNIPGVANWNKGFGAVTQNYYSVKINNLPVPIKWFKK